VPNHQPTWNGWLTCYFTECQYGEGFALRNILRRSYNGL